MIVLTLIDNIKGQSKGKSNEVNAVDTADEKRDGRTVEHGKRIIYQSFGTAWPPRTFAPPLEGGSIKLHAP